MEDDNVSAMQESRTIFSLRKLTNDQVREVRPVQQKAQKKMKFNQPRVAPDVYPIRNPRAIDGDTLEVEILLPFGMQIQKRIRLKGWWADELDGTYKADGLAARSKLAWFMANNDCWLLCPVIRMDKYGRVLADLWCCGKIVAPQDVLGHLQLTSQEHKRRKDMGKEAGTPPRAISGSIEAYQNEGEVGPL
jgi:endonuclease YncB( thermonuclease family)